MAVTAGRRARLPGVRLPDAAADAGLSERAWRNIEAGLPVSAPAKTYGMLEGALGWDPGTVERILSGGPAPEVPLEVAPGPVPAPAERSRRLLFGPRADSEPEPDQAGTTGRAAEQKVRAEIDGLWAELRAQRGELEAVRRALQQLEARLAGDRDAG
jgi:hypothetical protein